MSSAKVTLVGMNTYFQNANGDLFEFLSVPEGLDKTKLTNNILLEGGEFEVLYSDPVALKSYIGIWSDREADTFKRWVDALLLNMRRLKTMTGMKTGLTHLILMAQAAQQEQMTPAQTALSQQM